MIQETATQVYYTSGIDNLLCVENTTIRGSRGKRIIELPLTKLNGTNEH